MNDELAGIISEDLLAISWDDESPSPWIAFDEVGKRCVYGVSIYAGHKEPRQQIEITADDYRNVVASLQCAATQDVRRLLGHVDIEQLGSWLEAITAERK